MGYVNKQSGEGGSPCIALATSLRVATSSLPNLLCHKIKDADYSNLEQYEAAFARLKYACTAG